MLQAGIVGLPNVGKSTLFNALTKTRKAEAANYPFCTIDPNVGVVQVPDARLTPLAKLVNTTTLIPAAIEMVDIAGLVAGASKGEGLGNKFLANVREVDAIVHVVRCFEDEDVIHNMGRVDPIADAEVIMTELILADAESVTSQLQKNLKKALENYIYFGILTSTGSCISLDHHYKHESICVLMSTERKLLIYNCTADKSKRSHNSPIYDECQTQ